MSDASRKNPDIEEIRNRAAGWVLRCDRGLAPAEQDAFSEWLAANPLHGVELARHRKHWHRMDNLAHWRPEHGGQPNADLLAPRRRLRMGRILLFSISLAAAAIAVGIFLLRPGANEPVDPSPLAEVGVLTESRRVLEDGSVIELNRGAAITVQYSAKERRVRLERGEAHFAVEKNPARPFTVTARGIDVVAIGTAFNVRMDSRFVEVLVTEGSVHVAETVPAGDAVAKKRVERPLIPLLEARQRAIFSLAPQPSLPEIALLTSGEIERVLAWQHRLLDFTAAPLSEIVAEFNRRNAVQLVIIDSELASLRISVTFRSDNVDGFLRLLEAGFAVRAERRGDGEILLRKTT